MATTSYNSVCLHDSDAAFRTWGSAINSALTTVGLTQTADTGQINWTTVTRPATNTMAGYEIWRFNDTLQATRPIFIKLEYGTGTSASYPHMRASIGTGSDGAGTLSNPTSTTSTARDSIMQNGAPASTVTSYPNYFCYNSTLGFLGMAFWQGSGTTSTGRGGFYVCRSTDSSGAATGDAVIKLGATVGYTSNNTTLGGFDSASAVYDAYDDVGSNAQGGCFWIPRLASGSGTGTTPQLYIAFSQLDSTYPFIGLCAGITGEISPGGTYDVALIGSTSHTYIAIYAHGNSIQEASNTSTYLWPHLMLYE
jgi:hypothetical protein